MTADSKLTQVHTGRLNNDVDHTNNNVDKNIEFGSFILWLRVL